MADSPETINVNKFISDSGLCSRREADELIRQGKVTINGQVAALGNRVTAADEVLVNGKPIQQREQTVYLAFHKPVGITCTTDQSIEDNIIDYIGYPNRIFPVGRLDKMSEGLIFLTNDGDIVNKILRAANNHEKEYVVNVDQPVTTDFVQKMSNGVPILDTLTRKCKVVKEGPFTFRIVLTQGLNRQIRRMCEYLGFRVTRLRRVRIMHVNLGTLPVGKWRYLDAIEVKELQRKVEPSVKTADQRFAGENPPFRKKK